MTHGDVFQLDRADPLTAGLDDILGAIGDLQITVLVDRADVAGRQPAVSRKRITTCILVVTAQYPRTAHQHFARRLPVAWQLRALSVDHLHLDAVQRPPLFESELEFGLFG